MRALVFVAVIAACTHPSLPRADLGRVDSGDFCGAREECISTGGECMNDCDCCPGSTCIVSYGDDEGHCGR